MALIYWTRAAIQGNVDARVKMGDYYFNGIGTDIDYKKAKDCYYDAASESAIAMWNLGWIHESGIGVSQASISLRLMLVGPSILCFSLSPVITYLPPLISNWRIVGVKNDGVIFGIQIFISGLFNIYCFCFCFVQDFHLAKRWYDRSLASNPAAYLPVTLSLLKLYAHSIWNYVTGGDNPIINSNDVDDSESLDEVRRRPKGQQREGGWDSEEEKLLKDYNKRNKGDDESGDNTGLHDEHDYTEEKKQEEDVVETLMILAMCLLVGFLVYIRQLRWNQENNRAGGQGRVDGNERNRDGRGHQNGNGEGLQGNRWIDRFANLAEFVQ